MIVPQVVGVAGVRKKLGVVGRMGDLVPGWTESGVKPGLNPLDGGGILC